MRKERCIWISKILLISVVILPILTACVADGSGTKNTHWLPLAIGILLILGLIGAVVYLFSTRKLQKWASEGVGLGKSKYQASRLGNEKKKIDKTKSVLVDELGVKIWEAKIEHPVYAEDWSRLTALENQQGPILDDIRRLEAESLRVKEQRDARSDELNRQINNLQTQIQNLNARLSVLKGSQSTTEKNYQALQQRSNHLIAEIHTLQTHITQVQTSNAPDRDQQIFTMNNSIATHNSEILSISNQVPGVQSELTRLRNEQAPLLAELDQIKIELSATQDKLKQTVPPLDVQLNNLKETIKSKQEEVSAIKTTMQPIITGLGPLAEQARPDSVALNELYSKIDVEKSKLGSVTSEVDLTLDRIEATDKNSARNFYLMMAGGLVVLAMAIYLIVISL
ncbi:MAG: hypothetical protein WBI14_07905 [Anaerolineaceae bacterium]